MRVKWWCEQKKCKKTTLARNRCQCRGRRSVSCCWWVLLTHLCFSTIRLSAAITPSGCVSRFPVPKLRPSCHRPAEDFADEDMPEVEQALRRRMHATLEAATAVLQLVEDKAAARAAAGSEGDDAGEAAPLSPAAGARGSNTKDAHLAALNNLLKAENNRLRDQALLDATKIKQLQSSLAGGAVGQRRRVTQEGVADAHSALPTISVSCMRLPGSLVCDMSYSCSPVRRIIAGSHRSGLKCRVS